MSQPDLFLHAPTFDGETFDPAKDGVRLNRQLRVVRDWMLERSSWYSLAEISRGTGEPEASVSARLRDLRKQRFGAYQVDRRRRTEGQWEYRVSQ